MAGVSAPICARRQGGNPICSGKKLPPASVHILSSRIYFISNIAGALGCPESAGRTGEPRATPTPSGAVSRGPPGEKTGSCSVSGGHLGLTRVCAPGLACGLEVVPHSLGLGSSGRCSGGWGRAVRSLETRQGLARASLVLRPLPAASVSGTKHRIQSCCLQVQAVRGGVGPWVLP